MAKPIKGNPILRGKDALRFHTQMEADKNKKVDPAFIAAILAQYRQLKASSKKD